MNDYVEELVNHRKFIDVPEEDIDRKLTEQKKAQPQSIPYALCWMEMHPGYASLRFLTSSTPRNHPIGIGPKGFSWGVKTYSNLDLLLNDFKKNPKGAPAKPKDRGAGPREQPDRTDRPVAPTISRWGEKPVTTTTLPPPPQSGWGRPPPPPAPPGVPAMGGGWGKPVPPAAPAAPQTAPTAAWGRPAGPHATLPPQGGGAWGKPVAPAVLQPPPVAAGSWGKPAAPSVPLPPPTAVGNWGKPAPPPVPPQPPSAVGNWGKPPAPSGPPSLPEGGGGGGGGGWGTAVVAQRNGDGLGGWSQQAIARPPPPPPPPSLPLLHPPARSLHNLRQAYIRCLLYHPSMIRADLLVVLVPLLTLVRTSAGLLMGKGVVVEEEELCLPGCRKVSDIPDKLTLQIVYLVITLDSNSNREKISMDTITRK